MLNTEVTGPEHMTFDFPTLAMHAARVCMQQWQMQTEHCPPALLAVAHFCRRLDNLKCNCCCRWHLAVLGKKDGKAYLYNGLALLVAFITSRVVVYGIGLLNLINLR